MRLSVLAILALMLCGCWPFSIRDTSLPSQVPGMDGLDALEAIFLYSYAFCIIIMAACIAILIWAPTPSLKGWAWVGLTFAASVMGMGITFSVVKPFLPWIVLAGVIMGVSLGLWYFIANFDALRQFVHRDKDKLTPRALATVEVCEKLPPPTK